MDNSAKLKKMIRQFKKEQYSEDTGGVVPNERQLREDWGHRFRVKDGILEIGSTFFYSKPSDCSGLVKQVTEFAEKMGISLVKLNDEPRREWNNWPKESWATYKLQISNDETSAS